MPLTPPSGDPDPTGSRVRALLPAFAGAAGAGKTMERIVAVHQGALGDFLLMAPVLEGLHRARPGIQIDLWTKPEHAALLSARPYAGSVHPSDGAELAPFFHDGLWKDAPVPYFFHNASAILILGQASGRTLAENLAARLSSPVRWVRSFPLSNCIRHASLYIADQLREMGWPVEATPLLLDPLPNEAREVEAWLADRGLADVGARPVLIHAGSGGKRKVWPLSKWWGIMDRLRRELAASFVLTLGPADEWLREFAYEAQKRLGAHIIENTPLTWAAALAAASRAYAGSDSGMSHLAASMGTRSVVIFGPTAPEVWAPRGRCVRIVRRSWDEGEVFAWRPEAPPEPVDDAVFEAVATLLRS